jgi:ribosomal protein S18 acetylase RimI-like enzyme
VARPQKALRGAADQTGHPASARPCRWRAGRIRVDTRDARWESWIEDTWQTGDRIGEIESLSVLPEYRGSGLGSELLDRLETHLRERGVDDFMLGALAGNADAIRLYQRRGYTPTWLYLSKFAGRERDSR